VNINRQYTNVESGALANLLLVHCADAHHMVGHFPLRCYPADGWNLESKRPRDWAVSGLQLTGTEYRFVKDEAGPNGVVPSIVVANFLMRPSGRVLRDMDGLSQSIVGANGSLLGAGQLQVVFEGDVPEKQRDAAVQELLRGYQPVLEAILADAGDVSADAAAASRQ